MRVAQRRMPSCTCLLQALRGVRLPGTVAGTYPNKALPRASSYLAVDTPAAQCPSYDKKSITARAWHGSKSIQSSKPKPSTLSDQPEVDLDEKRRHTILLSVSAGAQAAAASTSGQQPSSAPSPSPPQVSAATTQSEPEEAEWHQQTRGLNEGGPTESGASPSGQGLLNGSSLGGAESKHTKPGRPRKVRDSVPKAEKEGAKPKAKAWAPKSKSPVASSEPAGQQGSQPVVDQQASSLVAVPERTQQQQQPLVTHMADELEPEHEVAVIGTAEEARKMVDQLLVLHGHVHACDTEVMNIDVLKDSPIAHGQVTCLSIYSGPEEGGGEGEEGSHLRIWVDLLSDEKEEIFAQFKRFFEDPNIRKVWHNYGFDRHVLGNHGIDARGFHADTMHLARLWDTGRRGRAGGYSLEALSGDAAVMDAPGGPPVVKRSMKELFGVGKLRKDGVEGKVKTLPPVETLQCEPATRSRFIRYSVTDAEATYWLWRSLVAKLKATPWDCLVEMPSRGDAPEGRSMYDLYMEHIRPFGELLTDMEVEGILVDTQCLAEVETQAREEQERAARVFRQWARGLCPDAEFMNVGSDTQIRQLLFAGATKRKKHGDGQEPQRVPQSRVFKVPNTEGVVEEGKKVAKKTRNITLTGIARLEPEVYTASGWPAASGAVLRSLAGKIGVDYGFLEGLEGSGEDADEAGEFDLEEASEDEEGRGDLEGGVEEREGEGGGGGGGGGGESALAVQNGSAVARAGPPPEPAEDVSKYGKAYAAFGGGEAGKAACHALAALCEVAAINTLISNFIQPLQSSNIQGRTGRVHCSLNINTETGRLSARRPSLQNQPALEKDRYKIRKAFIAAPGKSFIVADYGQLELRLLAHLAGCVSMQRAFVEGGDFHSRTALNMYEHVREAVARGDCLLEWEPTPEQPKAPVPLIKDLFASERRKAKMLNFSIAYGKTHRGLANDWKVSLTEAQKTLDLWYADRPEVRSWQQERIREAQLTGKVRTLMGRTRDLKEINSAESKARSHMERAAINTPVQGSAADVAMLAMLALHRSERLRELDYKLLLQVHDEVILEGPDEHVEEALAKVVELMCNPFSDSDNPKRSEYPLSVDLVVDAKHAKDWYSAK